MLISLELTARHAARVLTQAVRARAKLEIEPRPEDRHRLLWGLLTGHDEDALHVELCDVERSIDLRSLIGVMCDVRSIVCGQLCLFATFVSDVADHAVPARLMLGLPESIQLANRRRFARRAPADPVPARLTLPGSNAKFVAVLSNIGAGGLACRAVSRELDELLFIGDRIAVEFALPWSKEVFELPASVCTKGAAGEPGQLLVGVEFVAEGNECALQRLAESLSDEAARLIEKDGDA